MKRAAITLSAIIAASSASSAAAIETSFKTSPADKISQWTTDFVIKAKDSVSFRHSSNFLSYIPKAQSPISAQPYDGISASVSADIKPQNSFLKITTSLHLRTKHMQTSRKVKNQFFNTDIELSNEESGALRMNRSLRDAAAFAGIGFGSEQNSRSQLSYSVTAGAMMAHSSDKSRFVTADSFYDADPALFPELDDSRHNFSDDIRAFSIAPVVHAKFSLKF
jgi:hypothetical protein